MKLFVVGESSGKPEEWSQWGRRALVLAESLEQALQQVEFSSVGCEVDLSRPAVLAIDEPAGKP